MGGRGRSASPPAERVVAILALFAQHPAEPLTLTQVARALNLPRATVHGMLAALAASGWLYRNPDKSYLVGPAFAASGRVVSEQFSPMAAALPEMRLLADGVRAACAAVFREGHEVVVRARVGGGSEDWAPSLGFRAPLVPPLGAAFFVGIPKSQVAAWLEGCAPQPSAAVREQFLASLAFAERRGFAFGEAAGPARRGGGARSGPPFPATAPGTLDPRREYRLAFLSAPVRDARGEVLFVLNLSGFGGRSVRGGWIETQGARLAAAAERLGRYASGRVAAAV